MFALATNFHSIKEDLQAAVSQSKVEKIPTTEERVEKARAIGLKNFISRLFANNKTDAECMPLLVDGQRVVVKGSNVNVVPTGYGLNG